VSPNMQTIKTTRPIAVAMSCHPFTDGFESSGLVWEIFILPFLSQAQKQPPR
jgi:hypothetical protein